MKIQLVGRNGQVGWEPGRLFAPPDKVIATYGATVDLDDLGQIRRLVRKAKLQVIVNAAAYAAVDKAESEPEFAMCINGFALGMLVGGVLRRTGHRDIRSSSDLQGTTCSISARNRSRRVCLRVPVYTSHPQRSSGSSFFPSCRYD